MHWYPHRAARESCGCPPARACHRYPLARQDRSRIESFYTRECQAARFGTFDDGEPQRVFGKFFHSCYQRKRFIVRTPSAVKLVSAGRPSVNVPVLSTAMVSTSCMRSIVSALRNRIPIRAPCPMATVIEMGVARPTAQGQAMIRTAMALRNA